MTVQKRTSLDWEDLRVLAALASAGTLSAAARRLGVNHATIGRRLRRLERAAGGALFARGMPTPLGVLLLARAERMESEALEAERLLAGGGTLAGLVRITATAALAERIIAPQLGRFHQRHPAIDLELLADSRNLSLARREADIALRLARPRGGELVTRRVATIGYRLYAARPDAGAYIGYDLSADLPETERLATLIGTGRVAFRGNSAVLQAEACKAGLGIALLPCMLAEGQGLVRIGDERFARELWLMATREMAAAPRVRAAIDFLVDLLAAERGRLDPDGN